MKRRTGRASGFTLIELLVVISIVMLLIAMLLPVLGKARGAAKAAVCKSSQRQLALATVAYQSDYKSYFPQPAQDSHIGNDYIAGTALWFNALDAYLNQQRLAYSAADTNARNYREFKQDPIWNNWDPAIRKANRTIKMNEFLGHATTTSTPPSGAPVRFYRDSDVPRPSKVVLFADGRAHDLPSTSGLTDGDGFHIRSAYAGPRHDGGANVAHIDGHVAHQRNKTYRTAGGYVAWFDDDDPVPANRPESIFNFRPW